MSARNNTKAVIVIQKNQPVGGNLVKRLFNDEVEFEIGKFTFCLKVINEYVEILVNNENLWRFHIKKYEESEYFTYKDGVLKTPYFTVTFEDDWKYVQLFFRSSVNFLNFD